MTTFSFFEPFRNGPRMEATGDLHDRLLHQTAKTRL
jgi:hypothetical protein